MMVRLVTDGGAEVVAPIASVNPELVAHAERILERAKAGQISMIAFVASGPHCTDRGYCGLEDAADGIHLLGLLSRLDRLVQERTDALSGPIVEFPQP